MDERARGVILRTRLLTETSLIVQWLTADAGRVSTVARGARRFKSPFRGKLDLFHEADFTFRRSRRSDLHTLTEVAIRGTFPALRRDWRRLNQAAYGVALIELTTEEDTPLPEIWPLFHAYLCHLEESAASKAAIITLELKHLAVLGLLPDLSRESLPEESRRLAMTLLGAEGFEGAIPNAPEGAFQPLARFLHGFLIYHLGRLPRGRAEALADEKDWGS